MTPVTCRDINIWKYTIDTVALAMVDYTGIYMLFPAFGPVKRFAIVRDKRCQNLTNE